MIWNQGRVAVDQLLADGDLERVAPSRVHADRLLAQAKRHVDSAETTCQSEPEGAYSTPYDAARKALWSILANQGLRPTRRGGHVAAYRAAAAQLDPPLGTQIRPFDRMRRQRNSYEYAQGDAPDLTSESVMADVPKVRSIIAIADRVLDNMPVY